MKKIIITLGDTKYLVRIEETVLQPNRRGEKECTGLFGRRCMAHFSNKGFNCNQVQMAVNKKLRRINTGCQRAYSGQPDECYTIIKSKPCR